MLHASHAIRGRKILWLFERCLGQAQASREFMDLRGRVNTCT